MKSMHTCDDNTRAVTYNQGNTKHKPNGERVHIHRRPLYQGSCAFPQTHMGPPLQDYTCVQCAHPSWHTPGTTLLRP